VIWFITVPTQLSIIQRLATASADLFVLAEVATFTMLFCGVFATYVTDDSRWGFWAFAMICLALCLYYVLYSQAALSDLISAEVTVEESLRMQDISRRQKAAIVIVIVTWPIYGVVWALSEMGGDFGGICVLAEETSFAVLDVINKILFGIVVVYSDRSLEKSKTF